MKKFYPIFFFAGFSIVAFIMSVTLNKPSEVSYITLDSETQRMIHDDNVKIAVVINYLIDLQKKGVLPLPEAPKQ